MALSEKRGANALQVFYSLYDEWLDAQFFCGEARFKEMWEQMRFGDSAIVHRLKVVQGIAHREDVQCAQLAEESLQSGDMQIVFMRDVGRRRTALSPTAFSQLLAAFRAPPPYLEVLCNNNGLFSSFTVKRLDHTPSDQYIFIRVPFGPMANGSLMLHISGANSTTRCLIEVTQPSILAERFFELLSSSRSESKSTHPLLPLALFVDHLRILNEAERVHIDEAISHLESRSGVTLLNVGSRSRAKISEYGLLQRELHMKESLMAMAQHCFSFQSRMTTFAIEVAQKFSQSGHLIWRGKINARQASYIEANLSLSGTMAAWALEQLGALDSRLRVQGKVISSTISTTDTLTMIRLAQDSRSDSSTMKAITVLTMVFLPATFVCSLFSMGFFSFEDAQSGSELKVADQVWIYFVITIPLTVGVLGLCAAWLRWSGRNGDDLGEDLKK